MTHQEFIEKVMGLCRGEYDPSLAGSVALELIAHDKSVRVEIGQTREVLGAGWDESTEQTARRVVMERGIAYEESRGK